MNRALVKQHLMAALEHAIFASAETFARVRAAFIRFWMLCAIERAAA